MRKTLLALVITTVSINAFGFYREKCSVLECHDLSRLEIAEIKKEGVQEKFMNDEDTLIDMRNKYDESSYHREDFPTWYNEEFKIQARYFEDRLNYQLKKILEIEKDFKTVVPKDMRVARTQGESEFLKVAAEPNTCLVRANKGDRNKRCDSHRRSCAGQIAFIFTLGTLGSSECRSAYSYCRYNRNWEILVKAEVKGREVIQPYSIRIEGEYSEDEHHIIMMGMAHKAKKDFKSKDNQIDDLVDNMPKCE